MFYVIDVEDAVWLPGRALTLRQEGHQAARRRGSGGHRGRALG
ncbi:hypothetical protein VSR17_25670 [Cupriavidus taiwanensis]|nr:hypothetical protein [Cupriavidus taiwanensis]SOZ22007.1 hypothetical protein CBM2608_A160179 [Cupriavidus taiwanensis]